MTEPHTLKWESYFQAPAFVCVHTYVDGHTQWYLAWTTLGSFPDEKEVKDFTSQILDNSL
jgi:hypothetical protein